ncbi:general transcription factor IIF subunit 1 [Bufo gargarizans]|uniref:general transcription factor IIF subunit 1 n=1 Tax=Bufo gargarizans TaxID=30331 RepID=UPI001CF45178|nr:general transcription factor IIF subunit 1 [Bufo gargarizans]XP_044129695.1 general transcription factor IIF subunit 1 [Bufo gargarizans]XP_044129696.1 general transcription factor IIF subunit 1 [Bufo gargarizans]
MASLGGSSQSIGGQSATEFVVRVPRNPSKRYNLMAFNAADKVDFSTWNQARMERDLSAKKMFQDEEMPDSGAGSEYNRKQRDEARRRKYGIILREFKIEDQPWMLRVNGKAGRKFKGVKKGGVTENASYFIFTQCPDGAFEAFPVSNWYNFTPVAKHRTLTAEEAEQEWERRNKILNHFTIMQQRRLKDQGVDDDEEEGGGKQDKGGKSKKKKKNDLKIHDLEDDLELSSSESEESGEDGERKPKAPKKNAQRKKGKKSRSDDEAIEDSDDGDFEGQEVDYMSDGSSSDEELPGKPKPVKEEENHPKGIDEGSESSEESEEEKVEEEEEEEKKTPTPQEKKKKRDSSDESDTSEDSEIDGEASSALFMQKKKTPPKKDKKGGSNSSSRANSRPGTPSPDSGNTSNTLRAAANKLEQGKRGAANHTPAAKRLKMESGPQSTSGKSTPQPQSGKSTPSSGDIQLTEEAVRRYLTRKPMTTKDLLKKFQTKKTGLSSEQTVNVLAQILKRLNPDRKTIHDKMHFYLKE